MFDPAKLIIRQLGKKEKYFEDFTKLRWEVFRKPHGLGLGSEVCNGEENAQYVGAFYDSKLIGGAFIIPRGNDFCQLHQFVLADEFRKKGIGKLLLEEIEKLAAKDNFSKIYGHARVYMKQYYLGLGWKEIKENIPETISTKCAPGIPHFFMVKELKNE
ncbi:MAG: GNAT family N-acetyltransferase [archaeon]